MRTPSRPPAAAAIRVAIGVMAVAHAGCASAPSPLTPAWQGAIGLPGCGVLAGGTQIREDAEGLRWLRKNDRHWALPRFSKAIESAAATVAHMRPGAKLLVGDASVRTGGGPLLPHFSHRSGMDADLLLYCSTLDGRPADSPGFAHFGADGLAENPKGGGYLRFDVEREWLLIKTLLEDPDARIQWIFLSDVLKALLLEWATARGESPETLRRAADVLLQPNPGGIHDDHIHVRTSCSAEETVSGCQTRGPARPWLASELPPATDDDAELALSLFQPLEPGPSDTRHAVTAGTPWMP